MLTRLSQIFRLTPAITRQKRLDNIGYTNNPPPCFIDPISFLVMDNPYRFNSHDAQVTDWQTIQQYNKQTGRESNPFFQQQTTAIICEKYDTRNTAIELYVSTLENISEFFTQLEQFLHPDTAVAAASVDISNAEKSKHIITIRQIKHALIELLSQFIDQTIPTVANDTQLNNEEKTSALKNLLIGPEMLRELLLHEVLHVDTLTESNTDAAYQSSVEFINSYRNIAFMPFDNNLKFRIVNRISRLSDGKMAAELETIRQTAIAKANAIFAHSLKFGSVSSFCLFGQRSLLLSPNQQPEQNREPVPTQSSSPSLSRQMEDID